MYISLRRNIVANYTSQIYITIVAIVMVPTYLRHMGSEAYGLIGFFGMMQGWLQLMDMGLTASLSRQVASCRAGGLSLEQLNALIRSLAALFIGLGIIVAGMMWLASGWLATSWLQANEIPSSTVAHCLTLMGWAAAFRWVAGLYRGIIAGWEKQVLLGGYNISVATVRFVGVLPVFIYLGVNPVTFFLYQLIIAIGELIALRWIAGTLTEGARGWPCLKIKPVQAIWRFSGALAFCSITWVFITQTDKLVLSKTLSLTNYGYFSVAIMLAAGVNLLANPISGALLPRLTYLATQGNTASFQDLYRNATQWVSIIVWPAASMAAFFSKPLLFAWIGDVEVAKNAAPILFWYALGNACLGIAGFQFYMQYALGQMRLHMIGNILFVMVLIPSIVWASLKYGAVGAGRIWFAENLLFLLGWTFIVHRRFAPGLHWRWFSIDVLPIAIVSIAVSWVLSITTTISEERIPLLIKMILMGTLPLVTALLVSSSGRKSITSLRSRENI